MDDEMAEKTNDTVELKKEEMACASGGSKVLIEQPHCPGCGNVVYSYDGVYKCTTNGCKYKGRVLGQMDMRWM